VAWKQPSYKRKLKDEPQTHRFDHYKMTDKNFISTRLVIHTESGFHYNSNPHTPSDTNQSVKKSIMSGSCKRTGSSTVKEVKRVSKEGSTTGTVVDTISRRKT
jgi:hypothetical protein